MNVFELLFALLPILAGVLAGFLGTSLAYAIVTGAVVLFSELLLAFHLSKTERRLPQAKTLTKR